MQDPIFLLTNGHGSYLTLGCTPTTRYQGGFLNHKFEVFKVIENILPVSAPAVSKLTNRFWGVERQRGTLTETFFVPKGVPAVVYELSSEQDIQLDLDCRKLFDFRQFGRHYAIKQERGHTIIEFSKRTDGREDKGEGKREFQLYVVLNTAAFRELNHFTPVSYGYDDERGTKPHERHIYRAGIARAKTLVITYSTDRWKAIRNNLSVQQNLAKRKAQAKRACAAKIRRGDTQLQLAQVAAQQGLQSLVQEIGDLKGIYAGIYWFPQFWARDEAVSLKALMLAGKYALVKELLWKVIMRIGADGYIPNRLPASLLKCADGVGWVWKRVADFIAVLEQRKLLNRYLTARDRMLLKRQLRRTINGIKRAHMHQGFVVNTPKETWMDTEWGGDMRDGARIEIQALYLNMLHLMGKLCALTRDTRGKAAMALQERAFAQKVRKAFWNGNYLKDGASDATVRPNVFLAHYLYPHLLTHSYWEACFSTVLPKLWNDWGGLSTIDKGHHLFCANYTGENNQSYHRGDSWFWINNIAAICLQRIEREKFAPYIKRILEASTYELLWSGMVGYSAELSSSARLESKGCPAQAWSMATYMEMLHELGKLQP